MKRAVLVLVCLTSYAFAEQPWPKRIADAKFTEVNSSTLPKALREALLNFDEFSVDTDKLPDALHVCRIDLNNDGIDEFIVQSNRPYSGGTMMFVFERRKGHFVEICDLQGGIYFASRFNGYRQIVCDHRAGGGRTQRTLLRFKEGKYNAVRTSTDDY